MKPVMAAALSRVSPLAIALAALLAYACFIWQRAINTPFHDDVIDVLDFLLRFAGAGSLEERLNLLFAQYNDHRTATSRVIYLLALEWQGHLDFRTLVWIANLAIPVLAVLHAVSSPRGVRLATLVLAALVLCQPRGRDFLVWGMSVLAFHGVIVFGFAAFIALRRPTVDRFALAVLAGAAATCSLSSGQLVWLAGAAQLAWSWRRGEPGAGRRLLAWSLVSVIALLLFQAGFLNRNPPERVLGYAAATPLHHLQYFLALLGSAVSFENLRVALGAGAMLLVALPWIAARALRQGQVVQAIFLVYLLLSVVVLVLGRAPYSTLQYALDPRYSVFSVGLLTTAATIALAGTAPGTLARSALYLLALAFCVASYRVFTPIADAALKERIAAYNGGNYWVFSYPMDKTNGIVEEAVRKGFYRPPSRPLPLLRGEGCGW